MGICLALIIPVAFDFLRLQPSISRIDTAASIATLLIALSSLIISLQALRENRLLRQAGTDPVVLVHLDNRDDSRALTTIEISNVGAGAAREVSVVFLDDISEYVPDRIMPSVLKIGHPVRVIPQGSSVSFNFGLGHKLLEEPSIPPIKVTVSYRDIEDNQYQSMQLIDVQELKGQRADTPPIARIATSLEKLEKTASSIGGGVKPLRAVVQSASSHTREKREEAQRLQKLIEENKEQ